MSRRIKKHGYKVNIEKLRANAIDRAARAEETKARTSEENSKEASTETTAELLAETQAVGQASQTIEHEPTQTTVATSSAYGGDESTDDGPAVDQSVHEADEQEAAAPDDVDERAGGVPRIDLLHDRKTVDSLVSSALADGAMRGDTGKSADYAAEKSRTKIDDDTRRLIEEALANSTVDAIEEDDAEDDDSEREDDDDEEKWTSEELKTFDQLEEDDVLADSSESGAVRVLDSIVVYETENWMNEQTGKPYNRVRLRQQPPTIRFKQHVSGDETGEYDSEVKLVVTRKLAMQLGSLFDSIVASYDGRPIEDKDKKPVTLESTKQWLSDQWKYEPGKVIVVSVLAVLAIVLGVYAKFIVH